MKRKYHRIAIHRGPKTEYAYFRDKQTALSWLRSASRADREDSRRQGISPLKMHYAGTSANPKPLSRHRAYPGWAGSRHERGDLRMSRLRAATLRRILSRERKYTKTRRRR